MNLFHACCSRLNLQKTRTGCVAWSWSSFINATSDETHSNIPTALCFFKPVVKRLTVHVINEGIANCHKVFCGLNRFGLGLRLKWVTVIRCIGCLIGVSSTLYIVNLSRRSGIFSINCQTLRAYLLFPCANSDFPSCAKVITIHTVFLSSSLFHWSCRLYTSHLHYYTGSFLRICQRSADTPPVSSHWREVWLSRWGCDFKRVSDPKSDLFSEASPPSSVRHKVSTFTLT